MINFNIIYEIYFLRIYLFNFKFNNNYEFLKYWGTDYTDIFYSRLRPSSCEIVNIFFLFSL